MKFKIGKKYMIRFWDHCMGHDRVLCEVTVYITNEDKTFVYGTWWRVITDDPEVEEANREIVSIVKSAIVSKRVQK